MKLFCKYCVCFLLTAFLFSLVRLNAAAQESSSNPNEARRANLAPMPVISRNVSSFASSDIAANANDYNYGTSWHGTTPGWIAYDLSKVSADQRSIIIAAWYDSDSYDYDPSIKNRPSYGLPKAYTIEGNKASGGGSAPTSGWSKLAEESDNIYHSRQYLINFGGYNWLRMKVTQVNSASGNTASINLDVHNASSGAQDDWIFYGDSITAGGTALNGSGKGTIAQIINSSNPRYFPVTECGGTGSIKSSDGAQYINTWLSIFPGKYVGLAFGTNDAWGNPNGTTAYYNNMEKMVKAILAAGKTPAISKIPWARLSDVQNNVPAYNAKIDDLYKAYPQIIKGPDFWTFFKNNQDYIGGGLDNVHPTTEGYNAMREQWAKTMLSTVYK
jgi:lysophospholipase L1-like esterase